MGFTGAERGVVFGDGRCFLVAAVCGVERGVAAFYMELP